MKGPYRPSKVKFTAPRRRDLCWVCDRPLYAGGRAYRLVEIDGVERPVHAACAPGGADADLPR